MSIEGMHQDLLRASSQIGAIYESNARYTAGLAARLHKILDGRSLESLTLAELIQIDQRYNAEFNQRQQMFEIHG